MVLNKYLAAKWGSIITASIFVIWFFDMIHDPTALLLFIALVIAIGFFDF